MRKTVRGCESLYLARPGFYNGKSLGGSNVNVSRLLAFDCDTNFFTGKPLFFFPLSDKISVWRKSELTEICVCTHKDVAVCSYGHMPDSRSAAEFCDSIFLLVERAL